MARRPSALELAVAVWTVGVTLAGAAILMGRSLHPGWGIGVMVAGLIVPVSWVLRRRE